MSETLQPSRVAEDAVAAGEVPPAPSLTGLVESVAAMLLHGASVGKASAGFGAEVVRVALGRSEVTAQRGDWRFDDPTWRENPVYRRLGQGYLAACEAVDRVISDMESSGEREQAERARYVMGIVTSAVAPTNTLLGNPAALKKTLESGGANLLRGAGHFLSDVRHNGGMPSMTKAGALQVGKHLALTPGQVIERGEVGEVIQYAPVTSTVHARPVLIVPPPIGRFYFLDLQPGRSFVEYLLGRGLQTFMLSWRNPGPAQAHWTIDTYAQQILEAIDVVRETTGSEDVNLLGFCAGGILNTAVLNHLSATGDDRVHSASFAVTLLDWGMPAPADAFSSGRLLALARWNSRRAGVISARAMGNVFTWMRPNDLVWNYWVNNYLLGEEPPVFDILAWNADGTNLPAALHGQFLDIFEHNLLASPGALEALGTPIDVGSITLPTYVMGALNDHLTPWTGAYRTTQLVGGNSTFALSSAGHVAAMVNPPGNPKSRYFTGRLRQGEPAQEWLGHAKERTGSWWEHWADWATKRSGSEQPAPSALGCARHPAREPAPGTYVRERG